MKALARPVLMGILIVLPAANIGGCVLSLPGPLSPLGLIAAQARCLCHGLPLFGEAPRDTGIPACAAYRTQHWATCLGAFGVFAALRETPAPAQDERPRTTLDGVYTERQAKRGERLQKRACLHCHIPDFYKGGLINNWAGNTLGALTTRIANTMPQDRPSSLTPRQYADVMAFLLSLNGFPAGEEDLPSEDSALAKIIIERKNK